MVGAPPTRTRLADFGYATLGAFCFGLTIMFQRLVADNGIGAPTALGIRFAIAGLLLVAVLLIMRRPVLPPRGERLRMALFGLVLYSFESSFFFMALERGTAAAVALLFYSYPAVVTGVELGMRTVRPTRALAVALALSIGGAAVVALGGGEVSITVAGIGFTFASVACFSGYVLGSARWLVRTDSMQAATWTALGACVGVTTYGMLTGDLHAPSSGNLIALAANGVATAVAFTLFFVALARLGPSRTAVVMALEAVFAVLLAAVFLGERVEPLVALGGLAVLAGAVFAALTVPPVDAERELTPP